VKGTKEDATSLEGHSGRSLAERWGLPYREPHTLSIDPSALEIIDREEAKRLRVLPLELGTDGPVFAVAEPSEERFASVRELAGDNATFVVVAQESLDALLNSKVFSVSSITRRTPLLRGRTLGGPPPLVTVARDETEGSGGEHFDAGEQRTEERTDEEHRRDEQHGHEQNGNGHRSETPESSRALEELFSQIQTGAGSLRGQVDELKESLEAAQRELREANEQLAEAHRVAEGHNEVVDGLRAEIDGLRAETDGLKAESEKLRAEVANSADLNASMTSRLEEVARALMEPRAAE
jgi:Type II secretion system (T2SS), protein E, N-terminal domain